MTTIDSPTTHTSLFFSHTNGHFVILVIFSLKEQSKREEEEENQRPPPVPASQNPPETFRRLPEIPRDEPEEEAQAIRLFLLYFHGSHFFYVMSREPLGFRVKT